LKMEASFIITTTESIPGMRIVRIIGTVTASRTIWVSASRAMEKVNEDLIRKAREMGGNAIIGVRYQKDWLGNVMAAGTVVTAAPG